MKNLQVHLILFSLVSAMVLFSACGGHTHDHSKEGKEYTSTYVCPMHCERSGSDKMGTCPTCKMDYVKNEDHKSDGHNHEGEGDHDGHNHDNEDEHAGHNH